MTTQTLNNSLFESLNIGNLGVGHTDPVQTAYQGDVDNPADAGDGSFDDTLNRRIAEDEVTPPPERAAQSDETPAPPQEAPPPESGGDDLPVKPSTSPADPPNQASGKSGEDKGKKSDAPGTSRQQMTGPELLPVDLAALIKAQPVTKDMSGAATDNNLAGKAKHNQSSGTATKLVLSTQASAEASETAQSLSGSAGGGANEVLSHGNVKDPGTASLLEKAPEAANPLLTESGKPQNTAAAVQGQAGEAALISSAAAHKQQITDGQTLLKPLAQEAEAKGQSVADPKQSAGLLTTPELNGGQANQIKNLPQQATTALKQADVKADTPKHAVKGDGVEKLGPQTDQKTTDGSFLSANKRHDADKDTLSEQAPHSPQAAKQAFKTASSKIPSGPAQGGAVSKAVSLGMSNEGQAVGTVDHTVSVSDQSSIFETNVPNQVDVKGLGSLAASALPKSASISGQILESIQSSLQQGQSRLTIALNPPELGRVSVRFEEQGNQLIGILEVSQKQTRAEIEQALPQLLQNLQDGGVQIKRLDVMLNDQPEHGHAKDQSWNDATGPHSEQQNQEGREGRSGSDAGYDYEQPALEGNRAAFYESEDAMLVGNGAINMLA